MVETNNRIWGIWVDKKGWARTSWGRIYLYSSEKEAKDIAKMYWGEYAEVKEYGKT